VKDKQEIINMIHSILDIEVHHIDLENGEHLTSEKQDPSS